jgi:hypothetical protein
MKAAGTSLIGLGLLFLTAELSFSQTPTYPAELRGYKVERTIETRNAPNTSTPSQELIRFGKVRVARVTSKGVNLEIPIIVAPVKQKGQVDFLVFENIVVNGMRVRIDEYHRQFELPTKNELVLNEPLKFFVTLPSAILATIGEWVNSLEKWRVTGRVYVFGRYKKFLFTFKRTVPVELDLMIKNPLKT